MHQPAVTGRGLAARRPMFTSSQAASYVGVSQSAIRRWSDSGHLGSHRTPGGQRRFSREQLDCFIASLRDGVPATGGTRHSAAA